MSLLILRSSKPLALGLYEPCASHRGNALCDGWLPLESETKLSALVDSSDQGCGLGEVYPMSFIVHGEHPNGGGHSEFERVTAAGAVFKAADLVGDGWSGVHISDAKNKIYWPARFNRIPDRFSHVAVVSKPNA